MSHYITEPCIGTKDTSCVDVCPVDCIHPTKDEKDFKKTDMLYIDPEICIDCGLCIAECPVQAIFTEEDVPDKWKNYIKINTDYFKKKEN